MGTNYYHIAQEPCPCCKRPYKPRHIGKSSGGWCFALHVYPDEKINTLEDWIELLKTGQIVDEYDQEISSEQLINKMTLRRRNITLAPSAEWLRRNQAVLGPYNLARSQIDGVRCIGYADHRTPVDYFVGEFF